MLLLQKRLRWAPAEAALRLLVDDSKGSCAPCFFRRASRCRRRVQGPKWDNDRRRRELLGVGRTVLVVVLLETFTAKQFDRLDF